MNESAGKGLIFFFFIFGLFSNCLRVKAEGGGMGIEQSDDYMGPPVAAERCQTFEIPTGRRTEDLPALRRPSAGRHGGIAVIAITAIT